MERCITIESSLDKIILSLETGSNPDRWPNIFRFISLTRITLASSGRIAKSVSHRRLLHLVQKHIASQCTALFVIFYSTGILIDIEERN